MSLRSWGTASALALGTRVFHGPGTKNTATDYEINILGCRIVTEVHSS
jgi:hypothetical protein